MYDVNVKQRSTKNLVGGLVDFFDFVDFVVFIVFILLIVFFLCRNIIYSIILLLFYYCIILYSLPILLRNFSKSIHKINDASQKLMQPVFG